MFASALAALLVVPLACGGGDGVRDLGTRAVVIGIDSADWKVIDALIAEGELPNLRGLVERGVRGDIETLSDIPLSPVIWTSIATGKTAAKHGITWFMVDQADGTRVPVRSSNRKVEAIWNILARHKRRPVVLGWWATYPAEDVGRGTIVSDGLGFHGFGSTAREGDDLAKTYPARLYEEVSALVPVEQQVSIDFARRFLDISAEEFRDEMYDPARFPQRNPFNPIHLFQQYVVTAQGYTAIARELLRRDRYDLFMVYFEQVDSFSHLFMKYAPPRLEWVDEVGFARYSRVVRDWYRYQDELLGQLLAEIDLTRTAVFVLSDHGFKSGDRRIRSESTVDVRRAHLDHEPLGIFVAAGPHIRSGSKVEGVSVLDLAPTVLHYLGFPVARDMDGKVVEGVFDEAWQADHPIRYVETYERPKEPPKDKPAATPATPVQQTDAEGARNIEALQALGYVEGPADGTAAAAGGGESSPELNNNMGRIHLRNGDLQAAAGSFARALELDPRNAEALIGLGSVERSRGNSEAAIHYVQRALQVDPSSVAALSELAELERDRGRLDDAIRLFREALAIDDAQPWLHLGYGDVLQRAGRYPEALETFELVLQLDPDSFKARYNLGVTYTNMGKLDEAEKRYLEAIEKSPKDPETAKAQNNLGDIYLRRGETAKARERFEAAVAASPVNLEARYNLGMLEMEKGGDLERAVKLLEEAARLQPNHEQVTVRLGMAYLRAGRAEDAHRSFLLVRRLYPENWVAPLGLSLVFAANEQPDVAKKHLDEAVKLGGERAKQAASGYPLLEKVRGGG